MLDLDYAEDSEADTDANFVMTGDGRIIEVQGTAEKTPFSQDELLALMALAHLGAEVSTFTPALHCIVQNLGEGGRRGPYKAYEWNKMKTPTRILVGGPEVTSAFVLMALALARKRMAAV